ncbi:hypothetical protein VCJ_003461 [Vibrio metoecus]|nr:hypothetical protein VCJ_003461 [Vibrio metoecus]
MDFLNKQMKWISGVGKALIFYYFIKKQMIIFILSIFLVE